MCGANAKRILFSLNCNLHTTYEYVLVAHLKGSFMWMYLSNEMAHKFRIEAVEHMTSKAIHVSQNCAPNIQYPSKSLTTANVITNAATNRSAMANDAKNRFPILRRPRSV